MQVDETEYVGHMRVVKKLAPTNRGAIRLHEQFGKTLICVRHRVDAQAKCSTTAASVLSPLPRHPFGGLRGGAE